MHPVQPSYSQFSALARQGNLIPISCEFLADEHTPVSAFLKLSRGKDHGFLLESVEGGERWARYSFLGTGASSVFRVAGNQVEILETGTTGLLQEVRDPFRCFQDFMGRYLPASIPEMPRFFGGAVGYLGYDTVRHFEKLPETARRVLDVWDMYMVVPESLLIFDNVQHTIRIVSCCYLPLFSGIRAAYSETVGNIQAIIQKLRAPSSLRPVPVSPPAGLRITSNMSRNDYLHAVRAAKRYVRKGDIIQAVLSQRLQVQERVDPFSLYRALRRVNPSPYMFFLQYPKYAVVGSSPEVLVRVETPSVEVRPIAGTRPRGRDAREDKKRMNELKKDAKEGAEHIMLVDLGRNDVGRVSAPGSVRVEELMVIEHYSHVMHLVSHVKGRLARGRTCYDAFRACFPAGTLSGAPKIRAMEIIEELEPDRRGPYGGAVGYFSFSGNMDTAIAIRTILAMPDRLHFQAGAGIVADSRPEREYQECINKAQAMIKAIQMARQGFVLSDDWEAGVAYDLHD
jgi:anthranilate synthase component I